MPISYLRWQRGLSVAVVRLLALVPDHGVSRVLPPVLFDTGLHLLDYGRTWPPGHSAAVRCRTNSSLSEPHQEQNSRSCTVLAPFANPSETSILRLKRRTAVRPCYRA